MIFFLNIRMDMKTFLLFKEHQPRFVPKHRYMYFMPTELTNQITYVAKDSIRYLKTYLNFS